MIKISDEQLPCGCTLQTRQHDGGYEIHVFDLTGKVVLELKKLDSLVIKDDVVETHISYCKQKNLSTGKLTKT